MLPAAKQQKRSHHVKPVADSRARPITSFFSRPPPPSNDAERRRRLKNQLQLTASLAAINKEKDNAKAASNSLETATSSLRLRQLPRPTCGVRHNAQCHMTRTSHVLVWGGLFGAFSCLF